MRAAVIIVSSLAGLGFVYYGVVRRWMLRWGAKAEELTHALPGDEFILRPRTGSTRAITIRAPLQSVWPWIAQMGQGRGGLYSYDWLENLFGGDIHSADHVIPELQNVEVGDVIRLVKEGYPVDLAFEVAFVHPPRALVLRPPRDHDETLADGKAYSTWAFVLARTPEDHTRLLVRWRTDFRRTPMGYFWWKYSPVEFVNFVMERKMLTGLRRRAEAAVRSAAEERRRHGARPSGAARHDGVR